MAGAKRMVGGADEQLVTREDGDGTVSAVLNPELVRCKTEIRVGDVTLESGKQYELSQAEFKRLRAVQVDGKPVIAKA